MTKIELSIASEQIFRCPESEQRFNRDKHLRLLLKRDELTEAVDFLERKGIRQESSLKIFNRLRLNHTSEKFRGAERWRNLFDEISQCGTWGGEANA